MSPLVEDIPETRRGYPRAAGDIPNAARDVPGGRGYLTVGGSGT
jgi:hypothetical protein